MKLIKFEKENCPACTMVENHLGQHELYVEKVNPFDNPNLAVKYGVMSVPVTVLVDENGEEVMKSKGFNPDQLDEMIAKL